ncbi:MAG: sulfur carrier protein ThiS [Pyrinomonadaceae bacterium]
MAVELNHNVIRRAQWENTVLQADDKVEIVHFVGGGETGGGKSSRQTAAGRL